MLLRVMGIEPKAERVRALRLAHPDGAPLPGFAAGAHIALTLTIGARSLERHYSLVSDPTDLSAYAIAVLREERGVGSRFLHDEVSVNDHLEVSAPRNEFQLAAGEQPLVFIAGGIGITPILAMLRAARADRRAFVVHYSAQSAARMAYARDVEAIAGSGASLYLDRDGRGTMSVAGILANAPEDAHVYVCGPVSLINAVRVAARGRGWNAGQVHFESFGPRVSPTDRTVRVHLARSDVEVDVAPGQSILDVLLAAGAFLSYECRRGECGSCVATVLGGTPIHRDACLDDEGRRGSMCTCVSWASSERLVLDL
jgi:ferredoxin-NADP reductase